jgi:hypothetical protein
MILYKHIYQSFNLINVYKLNKLFNEYKKILLIITILMINKNKIINEDNYNFILTTKNDIIKIFIIGLIKKIQIYFSRRFFSWKNCIILEIYLKLIHWS